jgi:exonuclease III
VARGPCKQGSGPEQQSRDPRAEIDCDTGVGDDDSPYFGDKMKKVMKDHFRLASINLNNSLQDIEGDERLFRAIQELEIKLLCMQEVGCNWTHIPRSKAFQQRLNDTFGPHDTRSCFRHNIHDLTGTRLQWGGTGILCKGKLKHYAMGSGGDQTGLGRWTWARTRGKGGMVLRVVSVYCPCKNKRGTIVVWAQHKIYLQERNDDREPRNAFLEDLRKEIIQWIEEGDQVLVCGDLNHDIASGKIVELFQGLNMKNLIEEKHGLDRAPSTYFRDEEGRSVDGMWGTQGLSATRCGYLRPGEFPGDHSLL